MKPMKQDVYFATIEDPDDLANAMQNKVRIWRAWIGGRGLTSLWDKKLRNYYGGSKNGNTSQAVTSGGAEGELSLIKVNDLHALIQEQLVTVTSQRPAGQARAINSDTESLKNAKVGSALAEYYMSQVGFEKKFVSATERALLLDEGFVDIFWNKDKGDPIAVDPETGQLMMSGDADLRVHSPWNVARDPGMATEHQKWHILSYQMNRYDAVAAYPDFTQDILALKEDPFPQIPMNQRPDETDMIWVHLLVHDRTPAVPNGRYALMIGDRIVMDDQNGLPYPEYPVERITPSDVIDGPTGYCAANDILALEEMTDALHSVISTNQVTFGAQCIVGPEGANIKVTDLAKGVRYLELPPDQVDKLRPLQMTKTAPEIFQYIPMLKQAKEKAVGSVASALQAQAAQGASGSSMALIQSQSISFNSGTQRSYFSLLTSAMTKLIGILRVYADTPRIVHITGKNKKTYLESFKYTGHTLNSISTIVYEMVNPAFQTLGGRMTMAQDLIKAGMIKSPKQYITLVTTGQLETLTEDDEADQLLIIQENEWLMEGRPFQAVITQMHADHIKSHTSQITLEAQEKDPDFVVRTTAHIQEHISLWQQASMMNPGILIATNQQPLPPPPPPPGMPGMGPPMGPPMPPGPHGPPPGAPQGAGRVVGGGQPPVVHKAEETQTPHLPNIAGTKEKPTIPGVTDQGM